MKRTLLLITLLLTLQASFAQDTLKVMSYNILQFPDALPAKRQDTLKEILKIHPVDILGVCELKTEAGSNSILQTALNHNTKKYKAAKFIQSSKGDLHQMLYYNSDKLTLYSQDTILTNTREVNEYILYLNSPKLLNGDTVFLDVYVCHLKAGSDMEDEIKRAENIKHLKRFMATKPATRRNIILGDFNVYNNTEEAYKDLKLMGFKDPINKEGLWHNNSFYKSIFTQSTRSSQLLGEGSGGGIDDRFDMILCSQNLLHSNSSIHYIENSYTALGNNGNCFNKSIIDCSPNSSLHRLLYYMSDHLPVMMNFEYEKDKVTNTAPIPKQTSHKIQRGLDGSCEVHLASKSHLTLFNTMGKLIYQSPRSQKKHILPANTINTNQLYLLYFSDLDSRIQMHFLD